jgi:hypothetical protein
MAQGTVAKLLKVAWLSIGLGILIEILIAVAVLLSGYFPGLKPLLSDLFQKVTWSALVCIGLAFGKAMSNSGAFGTGASGFLVAPLAFVIARSVHKSASQMLGLAWDHPAAALLVVLGLLKAVEYAALGWQLSKYEGYPAATLGAHLKCGAVIGVLFGGAILGASLLLGGKLTFPVLLSRAINELIFPVGCSMVLYAAGFAGRMMPRPTQTLVK